MSYVADLMKFSVSFRITYTLEHGKTKVKASEKQLFQQGRGSKEAPLTHNLVYLQSLLELDLSEEHLKILADLTAYYIEGRYPSYKAKLSKLVSRKKSSEVLKAALEFYRWLKRKLK